MLGPTCVQELFSFGILHEAVNWSAISVHVPPAQMPRLDRILAAADLEGWRLHAGPRLLLPLIHPCIRVPAPSHSGCALHNHGMTLVFS